MAKEFISLKKEILGIREIEETVKAIEKISAVHLHRLKITSKRMEEYEKMLKKIMIDVEEVSFSNSLFSEPLSSSRLIVVLAPQQGLCGGFVHDLFDFLETIIKKNDKILVVGRKGKTMAAERKIKIDYFFVATKEVPLENDIKDVRNFILSQFQEKKVSRVLIVWPAFKSLAQQVPSITTFLPIDVKELRQELGQEVTEEKSLSFGDPIFEPSLNEIMDYLIKEYLNLVFYQKVLETKLSELSARTVFMEEAADKAKDLIKNLSFRYFKMRRKAITKEVTELYIHNKLKETCLIPKE
ncbi:F0F1 ATP synthase subunit gamma [bacterium]|nr:F0F1 ATP synthase subunit gamma [bacterium]